MRTFHLYWGRNRPLHWLQFMTVASLRFHHPLDRIVVHYPSQPQKAMGWETSEHQLLVTEGCHYPDWFPRLERFCELRESNVALPEGCSEIHRSDLLRWKLLAEPKITTLWSDFDILWLGPLDEQHLSPDGWDVALCLRRFPLIRIGNCLVRPRGDAHIVIPIGFLGSAGTPRALLFFDKVYAKALEGLRADEYQSAGRFAVEAVSQSDLRVLVLDERLVYPVRTSDLSAVWASCRFRRVTATAAIHWFAGDESSQAALSRITGPEDVAERERPGTIWWEARRCWNEIQRHHSIL